MPPNREPFIGGFNSVQLNVVLAFDIQHLLRTGDVRSSVSLMDNSAASTNQGTPDLVTHCKQGQVINWLTYPLTTQYGAYGELPPSGRINQISFVDERADATVPFRVLTEFGAYGGPDLIRSPLTAVYHYWAGEVLSDLRPGLYRYRIVLETRETASALPKFWNLQFPALQVARLDDDPLAAKSRSISATSQHADSYAVDRMDRRESL
jgi:hypothetical protein